jgi:hypothetical protein
MHMYIYIRTYIANVLCIFNIYTSMCDMALNRQNYYPGPDIGTPIAILQKRRASLNIVRRTVCFITGICRMAPYAHVCDTAFERQ